MLKSLVGIGMALCALSASGAEQAFQWTFTGAENEYGDFDETDQARGSFVVDDQNADGIFTLPEVKSFFYDVDRQDYCGIQSNVTCKLYSFSYTPGVELIFHYNISVDGDGASYSDNVWIDNPPFGNWANYMTPDSGEPYADVHRITAQTKISVSPVPEPQSYLLWGAGLLAIGAVKRRSRGRPLAEDPRHQQVK